MQEQDTFASVVTRRFGRRDLLKAGLGLGAAVVVGQAVGVPIAASAVNGPLGPLTPRLNDGRLTFTPIAPQLGDNPVVPDGYVIDLVTGWGDPITAGGAAFDLAALTPSEQARRVGFNCDFVMFLPLSSGRDGVPVDLEVDPNRRALLWINHEYTDGLMMFPGYSSAAPTAEQIDIELAAHGGTVVEIRRRGVFGAWEVVQDSSYNRRITGTTPMVLTGPAAGDPLLRTAGDPTGTRVLGMLNNCGGGVTPWGTILTAEENFNQYFANAGLVPSTDPRKANHTRLGLPTGASERKWETVHERFDVALHPNEPFRFGWIVEVDPYDPTSVPKKRTALGRFKHEAAATTLTPSGRVAVYSGDDERFAYAYKFVSNGTVDHDDRAANDGLLDDGTLYVARFNADGTGDWLPLTLGSGALVAPAFASQADVLIRAREAGDALGATKMDRPEDFEVNPKTGKVYLALTNNSNRGRTGFAGTDAANPRPSNRFGHVIELTEAGNDHAVTRFTWEIFLLCGLPSEPSTYFAGFDKTQVSPISCPDNLAFDRNGNLWIATDGQPGTIQCNDAVHAVAVEGPGRGQVKQFFSAVTEAEVASLVLSDDDSTMFIAVQHPGEGGSLANPRSTWPGPVARPTVVAVRKRTPGPVGS